ncbi:hypothetical protein [Actinosynnema sp. NPDC020468]|uniref:hypothetical protein n=1 Tax=Actinosynnema sp. NPDC020468 TaxID=3154488 RepID=UPI0033F778E5
MTDQAEMLMSKRQVLMPWLWAATVLAMLTSLGEGTTLMMSLGTEWYLALLFPLASDVGLIASLRGAAALAEAGRDMTAARPLRWFASLFCLALNTVGSVLDGHWVAALFHAGIPALVITLATFEEKYAGEFAALVQERRDAEARAVDLAQAGRAADTVQNGNEQAATEFAAPRHIEVAEPVRPRREGVTRLPRRTDAELIPQVAAMVAALPKGKVTRRAVQAELRVSPERAGRLLKAVISGSDAEVATAYL